MDASRCPSVRKGPGDELHLSPLVCFAPSPPSAAGRLPRGRTPVPGDRCPAGGNRFAVLRCVSWMSFRFAFDWQPAVRLPNNPNAGQGPRPHSATICGDKKMSWLHRRTASRGPLYGDTAGFNVIENSRFPPRSERGQFAPATLLILARLGLREPDCPHYRPRDLSDLSWESSTTGRPACPTSSTPRPAAPLSRQKSEPRAPMFAAPVAVIARCSGRASGRRSGNASRACEAEPPRSPSGATFRDSQSRLGSQECGPPWSR